MKNPYHHCCLHASESNFDSHFSYKNNLLFRKIGANPNLKMSVFVFKRETCTQSFRYSHSSSSFRHCFTLNNFGDDPGVVRRNDIGDGRRRLGLTSLLL